jgi:predicted nucleotide-binding protein
VRLTGIVDVGGGTRIYFWPENHGADWVNSEDFRQYLSGWADTVRARRKIFLGYCSAAKTIADALVTYLEHTFDTKVMNYATDFRPGRTILEEIEAAEKQCTVGIFLFTKDDQLIGTENYAAPRDNVIFEAGYFTRAKGTGQVLILREEEAKMPADLGGVIYILFKNRADLESLKTSGDSSIKTSIHKFLDSQL